MILLLDTSCQVPIGWDEDFAHSTRMFGCFGGEGDWGCGRKLQLEVVMKLVHDGPISFLCQFGCRSSAGTDGEIPARCIVSPQALKSVCWQDVYNPSASERRMRKLSCPPGSMDGGILAKFLDSRRQTRDWGVWADVTRWHAAWSAATHVQNFCRSSRRESAPKRWVSILKILYWWYLLKFRLAI